MKPAEQKTVGLQLEAIMKGGRWPGRRAMVKQIARFGFDELLVVLAHDGKLNQDAIDAQVQRIDTAWDIIRSETTARGDAAQMRKQLKGERRKFGTDLVRGYDGFRRIAMGMAQVANEITYDPTTERYASRLEAQVNARVR